MTTTTDLVTIKVDGVDVGVPPGTNVLEAIRAAGGAISFFCYHPGLSVVAVCRQCLVEIKGQPKLVPACQAIVAPGMEVTNTGPRVDLARQQMLEFTLLNHPVDCPICDKAGECTLQKQYMEWDSAASRTDVHKIRKPKVVDVGPHIVLDAERCILCTRCVRVCDEVAGAPELEVMWRGDHATLDTAPGKKLENPYSLCTVDVCPVGALTAKDFRFRMRAWELYTTPSVCNGCATGCSIEVHHRDDRIYRIVPRYGEINKWWMCDEGRFTYKPVHEARISTPRIEGAEATWDDALAFVARRLEECRPDVGVVLSATATNEDNYAATRVALDYLGAKLYVAGRPAGAGDTRLRHVDKNPNSKGAAICGRGQARPRTALIEDIQAGRLRALVVLGDDLDLGDQALALTRRLSLFVVQATRETPLLGRAHAVLPASTWAEVDGTITSAGGAVQRIRAAVRSPGEALPHVEILARLARACGLALDLGAARDVFAEMKARHAEFAAADFGQSGPPILLRFAGSRG